MVKSSETCDHKNDEQYDECIYTAHGQMMEENFSCSFEFLGVSNTSNVKTPTGVCTIADVNGKSAFQDIVYGISNKC